MTDSYAIALGNFDGLHIGHQCVIQTAKQKARQFNCKSAVITFFPHPNRVLRYFTFIEILSLKRKIQLIKEMGIDDVIVIDFSKEFSQISAEKFIQDLCSKYSIKSITTGYNFKFGYNREGNIELLHQLQQKYQFKYNTIHQIFVNSCEVSSSIMRQILQIGCVKLFSNFTHKPYEIACELVHSNEFKILHSILTPSGVYLGKIGNHYYSIILQDDQKMFVFPINHNLKIDCKTIHVQLLQIIKQQKMLDIRFMNEVQINHILQTTKFCLEGI